MIAKGNKTLVATEGGAAESSLPTEKRNRVLGAHEAMKTEAVAGDEGKRGKGDGDCVGNKEGRLYHYGLSVGGEAKFVHHI